jgi:MoaA/NifB/PqqE/SkfB family radical SAM enzyme
MWLKNYSKISTQRSSHGVLLTHVVSGKETKSNNSIISINVDESCNLACPSCRNTKINWTSGKKYEDRLTIATHLVKLINKFEKPLEIMMSGNGDPFASLIYRPLLLEMLPKENINIRFLTNGLLLEEVNAQAKNKRQHQVS